MSPEYQSRNVGTILGPESGLNFVPAFQRPDVNFVPAFTAARRCLGDPREVHLEWAPAGADGRLRTLISYLACATPGLVAQDLRAGFTSTIPLERATVHSACFAIRRLLTDRTPAWNARPASNALARTRPRIKFMTTLCVTSTKVGLAAAAHARPGSQRACYGLLRRPPLGCFCASHSQLCRAPSLHRNRLNACMPHAFLPLFRFRNATSLLVPTTTRGLS